jgi:hypothetical protein
MPGLADTLAAARVAPADTDATAVASVLLAAFERAVAQGISVEMPSRAGGLNS